MKKVVFAIRAAYGDKIIMLSSGNGVLTDQGELIAPFKSQKGKLYLRVFENVTTNTAGDPKDGAKVTLYLDEEVTTNDPKKGEVTSVKNRSYMIWYKEV